MPLIFIKKWKKLVATYPIMYAISLLSVCFLLLFYFPAFSQQEPLYPWKLGALSYINPGAPVEGVLDDDKKTMAMGISHHRLSDLPNTPHTSNLYWHTDIPTRTSTIFSSGIQFSYYDTNPIFKARVQIPAKVRFETENWLFSGGLALNIVQHRFRLDEFSVNHYDDPTIVNNSNAQWRVGVGGGIFVKYSWKSKIALGERRDYFFVGFGLPEVDDFAFSQRNVIPTFPIALVRHAYGTFGSLYNLTALLQVETNIWIRYAKHTPWFIDGNAKLYYLSDKYRFWIGTGFSNTKIFHTEVGIIKNQKKTKTQNTNPYQISLGYDWNIGQYQSILGQAIEISFSTAFLNN